MKIRIFHLSTLIFLAAFSGAVFANCADDAIDTCNAKHPDPNKSSSAYDKYELCIKAQLGQKCPSSSAESNALKAQVAKSKKGVTPSCPRGHTLKVDWSGKRDRCVAGKLTPKRAPAATMKMHQAAPQ